MNRQPSPRPAPPPHRPVANRRGRHPTRATRLLTSAVAVTGLVVLTCTGAAHAASPDAGVVVLAADSINEVVENIRFWLMGILAGWATLCLTVGFLRYTSGEDGEVERGKRGLRAAMIGYAGALLSPLIVTIVGGWVA